MKLTLLVALFALPAVVHAGPKDEAKKHIAKATEAHQQGKYDVALTELQAAYDVDPQPDLLYAIGQVQVKLGHCPEAVASYEKFLASKPSSEPAAAAQEAIDTCKAQTPTEPKPEPTPEPKPEPKPQPPPAPPPPPEGRPFYTDIIGTALVGIGVASGVAGGVLYMGALSKLDSADKATSYDEHEKLVDDAHSKRNLALICGGGAVLAIGVGVWHYTRYHDEQSHIAIAPTAQGGLVAWIGRF